MVFPTVFFTVFSWLLGVIFLTGTLFGSCLLTVNHIATTMNNLTKKIKISVVFSLIAAGLVLTGCASKSAKSTGAGASSGTKVSTSASGATASASVSAGGQTASVSASGGAAAQNSSAQVTSGVSGGTTSGLAPITYDALKALQQAGALAPKAQ